MLRPSNIPPSVARFGFHCWILYLVILTYTCNAFLQIPDRAIVFHEAILISPWEVSVSCFDFVALSTLATLLPYLALGRLFELLKRKRSTFKLKSESPESFLAYFLPLDFYPTNTRAEKVIFWFTYAPLLLGPFCLTEIIFCSLSKNHQLVLYVPAMLPVPVGLLCYWVVSQSTTPRKVSSFWRFDSRWPVPRDMITIGFLLGTLNMMVAQQLINGKWPELDKTSWVSGIRGIAASLGSARLDRERITDSRSINSGFFGRLCSGLPARLDGTSLVGSNLLGLELPNSDLSRIHGNRAIFQNANLEFALVSDAEFVGSNFDGANLASSRIQRSNFQSSTLTSVVLHSTAISNSDFAKTTMPEASFWESTILGSNFTGANLRKATLDMSSIERSRFTNANLSDVWFEFGSIQDTHFENASFAKASLPNVHFKDCILSKAIFSDAYLLYATFENCDLSNADFSRANMGGVSIRNCKMNKSNLSDIDMFMGELIDLDLTTAILTGAAVSEVRGERVKGFERPKGSKPKYFVIR